VSLYLNPSRKRPVEKPWYETAFGADYLARYAHRSERAGAREVAFLKRVLCLSKGARILDLCCGAGRHCRALAGHGYRVVGADLSFELLRSARAKDRRTSFVRADARHLPLHAEVFDGVVNLFTSFGYFETAREDLAVLRGAVRALRPDGVLVLDFFNLGPTLKGLVARTERRVGRTWLIEERWHDRRRKRLEKRIRIEAVRRPACELRESVRAYSPAELQRLARRAGLTVLRRYGDLRGAPFYAARSPRCVLVARKDV
jgi:SAM-dependent methyltransferase